MDQQARRRCGTTEATLPALEARSARTVEHEIAFLLGEDPDVLATANWSAPAPLPVHSFPAIPIGVPSELLRRRPDVRAWS